MFDSSEIHVWIVEDDPQLNNVITRSLKKSGFACKSFFSGRELLQHVDKPTRHIHHDTFLLLDFLLEDMNAIELVKELKAQNKSFPFMIMTGCGDEKSAVNLMKLGAIDYVIKEKHFIEQIVKTIHGAKEKRDTQRKLDQTRRELHENALKLEKLNKQINLQKLALETEKAKTDKLLQSILPKSVAKELLDKGYSRPRQYDRVSILFADVIGFSDLAKKSPPIKLVNQLDYYFYVFDEIIEQYGMEKIKTIGDCYMCAGGIPEVNENNAIITVLTGLKIQQFIGKFKEEQTGETPGFTLRLGIHTGEVVAGVVGKNKFAYDIWGDAVNIASRIVEAGEEGKVNISQKTFELVKDYFICSERGDILTKNNYSMKMYFVDRLKPEFSSELHGTIPNHTLMKNLDIRQDIRHY